MSYDVDILQVGTYMLYNKIFSEKSIYVYSFRTFKRIDDA